MDTSYATVSTTHVHHICTVYKLVTRYPTHFTILCQQNNTSQILKYHLADTVSPTSTVRDWHPQHNMGVTQLTNLTHDRQTQTQP
jgi:hypothetical protein